MRAPTAKPRHSRPRWAGAYLLVTALVVPLVYSSATLDPVLLPGFLIVAMLGLVLLAGFAVTVVRRRTTVAVNRAETIVLGSLAAYILWAAITLLAAGPTPDGIFELLRLVTFAWLIHASTRAIAGERGRLLLLAKFVVVTTFLVGGFAVLQFYQLAVFEWMKHDTTVDSTMGHRNLLASFLLLAFPFVVYGFLELDGRWRVASATSTLISAFLLVALQTRSAWVAFLGGMAFSLVILAVAMKRARSGHVSTARYRRRMLQAAGLIALGLCIALLFHAPGSRAPMREHAGSLVQLGDASIQERLQLWSRTIQMIRDHPVTGVGLGNWRVVVPTYGAEGLRSETGTLHFQRPHNDFLWVASETGLLGGALYLMVFVTVIGLAVATILRAPTIHDRLGLTLMLFGVSSYVIDALFSFPKERTAHSVYLALLIGTLLSLRGSTESKPSRLSLSRRWTLAIAVLAGVAMLGAAYFAMSRYRAEVHLRRALHARAVKDWASMIAHLDRIDVRTYVMDPSSAPVAWYRGVARFEMGERAAALEDFRSALQVHPNHVHVLNNIATCETLLGKPDDAIPTYKRAIEIAPRFEEARVNLGGLLHSLGRDREAYEVLAPAAAYATSPRFSECLHVVRTALGLADE